MLAGVIQHLIEKVYDKIYSQFKSGPDFPKYALVSSAEQEAIEKFYRDCANGRCHFCTEYNPPIDTVTIRDIMNFLRKKERTANLDRSIATRSWPHVYRWLLHDGTRGTPILRALQNLRQQHAHVLLANEQAPHRPRPGDLDRKAMKRKPRTGG
jgi:hypothetical protein